MVQLNVCNEQYYWNEKVTAMYSKQEVVISSHNQFGPIKCEQYYWNEKVTAMYSKQEVVYK